MGRDETRKGTNMTVRAALPLEGSNGEAGMSVSLLAG